MKSSTTNPSLHVLTQLPAGLTELPAEKLRDALPGPTLLDLPGTRPEPLFVSVLLHGNETTGWEAARRVLREHIAEDGQLKLPRRLILFIGNIDAAARSRRHLDHQVDFNRIWAGSPAGQDGPEYRLAREVLDYLSELTLFASIDIHNNTGRNPHYGCVNKLEPAFLRLAALFGPMVIYFLRPREVQSMAFSRLCPAVTVECGRPGEEAGEKHATEFLNAALRLHDLSDRHLPHGTVRVYHTVATVKLKPETKFVFDGSAGVPATETESVGTLVLPAHLDEWNFQELPTGTVLARLTSSGVFSDERLPMVVLDEDGRDIAGDYLRIDREKGQLLTRRPIMPSMFTLDDRVIRQDCLGYLMESYPLPGQ